MSEEQKSNNDAESGGESDLGEGEYEVEQILNVGAVDGEVKYLVRWKGYQSGDDTWEPEANLETAKLLLEEYVASHPTDIEKAKEQAKKGKEARSRKRTRPKPNRSKPVRRDGGRKSARLIKRSVSSSHDSTDGSDGGSAGTKSKRTKKERNAAKGDADSDSHLKLNVKDIAPVNPRNSWLYDGVDDADSDATDAEADGKDVVEPLLQPDGKDTNDEGGEAKKKSGTKKSKAEKKKSDWRSQRLSNGAFPDADYSNPDFIILGLVRCSDGALKVLNRKKGENITNVVSLKEAHDIAGFALVEYLVNRCEFGPPAK